MKHPALLLMILLGSGCATGPDRDPVDPFEPLNRAVDSFNNDLIDRALLRPFAEVYYHLTPQVFIVAFHNFFSNLGELLVIPNDIFQGKFTQGLNDTARFVYNTTFGLAGFFDVASAWGLSKHNEDFGQTLGYWGISAGPYLVLPFLGPRTVRDAVGLAADMPFDPVYYFSPQPHRNATVALRLIDMRTSLLGASRVLEEAALDPYLFVRDAYLQQRASLIRDGQAAPESEEY